jgi:hypothetical protein
MAIAQYLLVGPTPSPSFFFFTRPTSRAAMSAFTICFIILFFVTRRSVICALRSGARAHADWHAFVLAVESFVIGMRLADDEAGIGISGQSVCVVIVLALGLVLMRRGRNG